MRQMDGRPGRLKEVETIKLIIGGIHQGKRAFACRQFPAFREQMESQMAEPGKETLDICDFLDGKLISWEEFLHGSCTCNLHQMIRRRLEAGERASELEAGMARELIRTCPDRILITDEIGYGIVPIDPFEREYRELTGRICCQLAAEAKEVWRVTAGIGIRIK